MLWCAAVTTVPQKETVLQLIILYFVFPFLKAFLKLCLALLTLFECRKHWVDHALWMHRVMLSSPLCWSPGSHGVTRISQVRSCPSAKSKNVNPSIHKLYFYFMFLNAFFLICFMLAIYTSNWINCFQTHKTWIHTSFLLSFLFKGTVIGKWLCQWLKQTTEV